MQQFILQQNIALFQSVLETEWDDAARRAVRGMLFSAQRELAMLESSLFGAYGAAQPPNRAQGASRRKRKVACLLHKQFANSSLPYVLLDPQPGLHIVDINDAYAKATMTARRSIVGHPLFQIFPDNPGDPNADGLCNLYASLRAVATMGQPHAMPILRYDVRDLNGRFVERYWQPLTTPVRDKGGYLLYLRHHVEDVTGEVRRSYSTAAGLAPIG
jgi:hypothetical protein